MVLLDASDWLIATDIFDSVELESQIYDSLSEARPGRDHLYSYPIGEGHDLGSYRELVGISERSCYLTCA